MAERPTDRCPYLRPFPEDFRGCSVYAPSRFVALDTGYRPLAFVWTCSHLDAAAAPQRNRWYARCRIGDAAARTAWVTEQRVDRLAVIRALQDDLNEVLAGLVGGLWEAKGRQLRSEEGTAEYRAATAELRRLAAAFMNDLERFLEENSDRLGAVGVPVAPCIRLFTDLVDRWVEQPSAEPPMIADSELEAFPPDTRVLIKPDYAESAQR